jgi:hypothetical protein
MNNCRIPSLLLSFLLLLVLTGLHSRAQTVTNTAALQRAGQALTQRNTEMQRILVTTALEKGWSLTLRNKKGRLAYLRGIDSKGFPQYVTTTDNIISAATIRTNQLWPGGGTGLNLNGSSANMKGKIAVWDEGLVRPTHVELIGRVTQVDGSATLSDHSTHVSGTMIAAGVNPAAKGMSYGAQQLLTYDFSNDEGEMSTAAGKGLLISNHSYADIAGWFFDDAQNRWEFWGNPGDTVDLKFGLYDQDTQIWDSIAYNAPNYLIVKAGGNNPGEQGPDVGQTYWRMNSSNIFVNSGARPANISSNAGYETIATYGNAKNILCLGAVNPIPGGYSSPSDVVLASFSSLGPTGDGRIKPDLVADGVNVLSSVSTADNAYDIFSGTSMATPAAAGSAFLLQEYYSQKHPGTFMRAATLKGLLIHTADEAGLHPGPDYAFGWGLINMQKAASVITSDLTDHSQQIFQNQFTGTHASDTVTIIASGKTPLVATISWTEPPSVPFNIPGSAHNFQDTTRKLLNDLDLRIVDSNASKVFMPWTLNPFNRPAAAAKGDNIRDNVEKVELGDTVIPGHTYKVIVTHKGTNLVRGTQAYSLLISGGAGTTYCTSASTTTTGTVIDKVTLGSNLPYTDPSPCGKNYADLTSIAPLSKLALGQTLPVNISYHSCGPATTTNIAVYIDFNNNGLFEASELVSQNLTLLSSGTSSTLFTGAITIPVTAVTGTSTRMRIIAQDNAVPATPPPCGSYTAGETQDYTVAFTHPFKDVGVTGLEYPSLTTCASDSQLVSIHIRNFGDTIISTGVPVTTTISGGTNLVLTATCKDSIPVGGEVIFTYNKTFPTVAGASYTFVSQTGLTADPNTSNDSNRTTVTINAASANISGTATICGTNATQVVLKATTAGIDLPVWYETATSATPIAAGDNTTSTVITPNKTYYVGANDLKAKAAIPNKTWLASSATTSGSYFGLGGNFVKFSTNSPITIESARMYVGHGGQVAFTLATFAGYNGTGGNFSYLPLYNTTIDVQQTKPAGNPNTVPVGDNTDTGAVFLLNIPVPTPGDYIIIIDCLDSSTLFVNNNVKTNPYPVSLAGIISITGNDQYDFGKADSATVFQKVYYPFYNMGIRLSGCPGSARTAVTATTKASPVITLSSNVFTSNVSDGNQWFLNDSLLNGSTGMTDTVHLPGVYYTVVTDPVTGCILTSNKIMYTPSGTDANSSIGLTTSPNPSNGTFQLEFYMSTPDNTSITLTNTLGQKVYEADYPGFSGIFSQQVNAGNLASGLYILKIYHGGNTYTKKLIIKK